MNTCKCKYIYIYIRISYIYTYICILDVDGRAQDQVVVQHDGDDAAPAERLREQVPCITTSMIYTSILLFIISSSSSSSRSRGGSSSNLYLPRGLKAWLPTALGGSLQRITGPASRRAGPFFALPIVPLPSPYLSLLPSPF